MAASQEGLGSKVIDLLLPYSLGGIAEKHKYSRLDSQESKRLITELQENDILIYSDLFVTSSIA
jgi:hypothetical protein